MCRINERGHQQEAAKVDFGRRDSVAFRAAARLHYAVRDVLRRDLHGVHENIWYRGPQSFRVEILANRIRTLPHPRYWPKTSSKISATYNGFKKHLDKALPIPRAQLTLGLNDTDDE